MNIKENNKNFIYKTKFNSMYERKFITKIINHTYWKSPVINCDDITNDIFITIYI